MMVFLNKSRSATTKATSDVFILWQSELKPEPAASWKLAYIVLANLHMMCPSYIEQNNNKRIKIELTFCRPRSAETSRVLSWTITAKII